MQEFWDFVENSFYITGLYYDPSHFDYDQIYLKLQATNVKNEEVTANPKPKLENHRKKLSSKTLNPRSLSLDPQHQIHPKP